MLLNVLGSVEVLIVALVKLFALDVCVEAVVVCGIFSLLARFGPD